MLAFHHTTVPSTNDAAQRLAALNRGVAVLVSARTQTRGRGRQGRRWHSPAGGAWFSVAWPLKGALDAYAAAPLVAGLALATALDSRLRLSDLTIKWPNDVLLHGRKLAGILCETQLGTDCRPTLIVGVGINVNIDPAALGDDLRHPAIALREVLGHDVPLQPLIEACGSAMVQALSRLERDGLRPDEVAAIDQRLAWRGEPVTMHVGDTQAHGVLDGIEPDGRLRLLTPRGAARFRSGEVSMLRRDDLTTSCSTMNEVLI